LPLISRRSSARVRVPNPVEGMRIILQEFCERCDVLGFGAEKAQSAVR
jgi:hypothetical protein